PNIYEVDFDKYYADNDVVALTRDYYAGIGLPIDDIIDGSDLYEKEGKYQHAYCTDIDREGDVRVVANIKDNSYWMSTMLHEYGHGAYFKLNDRELPWTLRTHAHTLTNEAVAMMFGRLAYSPAWLQDVVGISAGERETIEESSRMHMRSDELIISRWIQVMYRFEKSMYENSEQDLNKLWWDLVEEYQLLKRPEGRDKADWASKIHILMSPAYYHNYMLGDLFTSQLYYHICEDVLEEDDCSDVSFAGREEVGEYLIENVFMPGKRYQWNEMIERATGEKLTAKYFAMQYVSS
ncbi:MAG: M2 family metallopeptidase, partial [Candidatus Saganbacteria bacterium]|nr:M2 family metallopeptidase [Candidatus Saganbacteria bacterium]